MRMARKTKAEINESYNVRRHQKRKVLDALKNAPCMDCGKLYPPPVMEWDHVRGDKEFKLSDIKSHTMERILAEIAKCDLVCANCHRLRTWKRKQYLSSKTPKLGRSSIQLQIFLP